MKIKLHAFAAIIAALFGLNASLQAAAPQITGISTPGGAVPGENVSVSASASDEDGDLVAIYITITGPGGINGGGGGDGGDGYSSTGWGGIYTAYSGSYLVEVVVVDAEGNEAYDSTYFDAERWWG
jgi:hypothetical protein